MQALAHGAVGAFQPPAPLPAAAPGLLARGQLFVTHDVPHWLGNLGASFPTAIGRGLGQTVTAYAGFRASELVMSSLDDLHQTHPHLAANVATGVVCLGGGALAVQAGLSLYGARRATREHAGQPPPSAQEQAVIAAVTLFIAVAPLMTALTFICLDDEERGFNILNSTMGIVIAGAVRDLGNDLLPRLPLADYVGGDRLEPRAGLLRRYADMMGTSLVFNIPFAALSRLALQPAIADLALVSAMLRGLYAVGNELSRGWAASRDGPEGNAWPGHPQAPRLSPLRALQETATRYLLALPAAGLYGWAQMMADEDNPFAYDLLLSLAFFASGISEFRGPIVELSRIAPVAADAAQEPPSVSIHVGPGIDLRPEVREAQDDLPINYDLLLRLYGLVNEAAQLSLEVPAPAHEARIAEIYREVVGLSEGVLGASEVARLMLAANLPAGEGR